MKNGCKILYRGGEGEIVEKKSRFIATIRPAETEADALALIAGMKKKYWDASHNCSAFLIGENHELTRCSDDGEPPQTAGRPMLDVLSGQEIHNVCAVVTRYFGGTLLGTGGLVRAYGQAVKEGLSHCVIVEKKLGEKLFIETDYGELGKIQYICGEEKIPVLDSEYGEKVRMTLLAPAETLAVLKEKLTEATGGRVALESLGAVWFGTLGKETVLL